MIIGVDASRANEKKKTGTEWYSYYLIQEFKKIADPRDHFVLYSKEPLRDGLKDLPANFESKVLYWPPKLLWTLVRFSIEMLIHPPDVFFVPAHNLPIIHPKNTVATLHDIGFERFKELYSTDPIGYHARWTKRLLRGAVRVLTLGRYGNNELDYQSWSARFMLRRAKKIITISEFTKQEILDVFHVAADHINVIPNGYDRDRYHAQIDPKEVDHVLSQYQLSRPYIFYIGRLERKKNIAGLIDAFAIFKQKTSAVHKLVLLGFQGYGFEEIQQKIDHHRLNRDVIIPGYIPEEHVPMLYAGAELFVFPSFYEGFGIPLLQAMACGVPILASRAGAIPEVVQDAAVLVDPKDPVAIATAIERMLNDASLRSHLKQTGLDRVKHFSWHSTAQQTLAFVKSVSAD
jgi:glycosyltransferase involved in cell wall biosynthesis